MRFEFAGLPGSGKSTTVRNLTAELPSARNVGLLKLGRREIIHHPVAVARHLVRWRSLARDWSDKRALFRILRRRISQDLLEGAPSSFLLLEEGITHYIWRQLFLFPHLGAEPWDPFLEVDYPLVVLDADPPLIRSRTLTKGNRGRINDRLAALATDTAEWTRAESLYEQTIAHASRYRRVLRVDATADPASTVERVRDLIVG
jgi:hypothetical protein